MSMPRGVPTGARGIRYLATQPGDAEKAKANKPAEPSSNWGARFAGAAPALGAAVSLLSLPSMGVPPHPIGVQFWRSTESSAPLGGATGNADVRAVVTFSAGESRSLVFRCDWQGGLLLHAQSVSVDLESFNVGDAAFVAFPVDVAVALALGAPRPLQAPTLTYRPTTVAPAATRELEYPALATRVGLLVKYGEPVGSGADAPLGQIFLTFCDRLGNAIGWIDAQNARSALFGDGVPLPAGTNRVVLSNRTAWDVSLGAVFHLGL
jgi:hypothetical protein